MFKKILPIFFVTLLALILIGIKVYPTLKSKYMAEENAINKDAGSPAKENTQHIDKVKEPEFPFAMKAEEDFARKYPKQFEIVKKMYYSWDYIRNAQGVFEYGYESKGEMAHITFYLDLVKKRNKADYVKAKSGKVVEEINLLYKDGIAIRQKPNQNLFTKDTDMNKQNHYLSLFNDVVINSEWFMLIYNNYPDWSFKEGNQFGMPVYQIEGEITNSTSEVLAGPFTMTVSKETGALLDLKAYGNSKEAILTLDLKEISINKGIGEGIFQLDTSGGKEVSNHDFNISGIENYQEKSGGDGP
jgi:hypothetical protein